MKNIAKYTDSDIDEDMKLTHGDYMKILHHYQGSDHGHGHGRVTRKNRKSVKERAHRILADKLCRCIKATSSSSSGDEGRRIAYCTRSIFNTKGLRSHGFQCKTQNGKLRPRMTRDVTKKSRRIYTGEHANNNR
jgi:hypothetical protein